MITLITYTDEFEEGAIWDSIKLCDDLDYRETFVDSVQLNPKDIYITPQERKKVASFHWNELKYFFDLYKNGKKPRPIWVREFKDGYQILDGHHRLTVARLLRLDKIDVCVVPKDKIKYLYDPTPEQYDELLRNNGYLKSDEKYATENLDN